MAGVRIVGVGAGRPGTEVPGQVISNDQLTGELLGRRIALVASGDLKADDPRFAQFETSDEWIAERTGIRARRRAAPDVATSDLAIAAGRGAMQMAGWKPEMVDGIYLATVTPDHPLTPPTFAIVQHGLGIPTHDAEGRPRNLGGMDCAAACSSFGQVFRAAHDWTAGAIMATRRTLVIGADEVSRWVDPHSRNLTPILADGGGALAIESTCGKEDAFFGDQSFFSGMDGSLAGLIKVPAGGSRLPTYRLRDDLVPLDTRPWIFMDGRAVMKQAVRTLVGEQRDQLGGYMAASLQQLNMELDQVDFLAMHQANQRITAAVEERLRQFGFKGVVYQNIERYANTTSGTIPLVLYDAWQDGTLQPGMLVWSVVFGGGFTVHLSVFRWTLRNPVME